jgi:hypothetical protein
MEMHKVSVRYNFRMTLKNLGLISYVVDDRPWTMRVYEDLRDYEWRR